MTCQTSRSRPNNCLATPLNLEGHQFAIFAARLHVAWLKGRYGKSSMSEGRRQKYRSTSCLKSFRPRPARISLHGNGRVLVEEGGEGDRGKGIGRRPACFPFLEGAEPDREAPPA